VATFEYKAISPSGTQVTDAMEGTDPDGIAARLSDLGYLPIEIKPQSAKRERALFSREKKLNRLELIVFTKQLVTLLRAGVPLLACLEAISEQAEGETLKKIIEKIYVDIESGLSFSDALRKHPRSFDELYVNSIRAGEMGGALDEVLRRLAELLEFDHATRARIKSAMRYPIIVVVALVLAFFTLMMLVVPKFIALFESLGVELPLPTRLLILMYTLTSQYWFVLLALAGLGALAFHRYVRTEQGAYRWDRIKISAPVFGPLLLKTAMSRFTRMFETLNSSGLPILQTLEISAKTVGNRVVGRAIEDAAQGILQGEGLARPLERSRVFPPMVIRMISIGEQSGSLDEMLMNVSSHYDSEVEYAVKGLTSMIEPILTVGVGLIVLFMALAIFLPMWNLTKLAQ